MAVTPTDRTGPHRARTSRWLAHHGPEHLERCTVVAGHHVCRRCLVLYPAAVLTGVLVALLAPGAPGPLAVVSMWLLPVPAVVDWTLEHLGMVAWSRRRQVVVTLLAAPALGVALAAHAHEPFTHTAVVPMAFWTLVCLTAAMAGAARRDPDDWRRRHEAAESGRAERLKELAARR
ncbi:MAG: hypothetical protein ACKO04_00980 [Actinomycetes bacterium]